MQPWDWRAGIPVAGSRLCLAVGVLNVYDVVFAHNFHCAYSDKNMTRA